MRQTYNLGSTEFAVFQLVAVTVIISMGAASYVFASLTGHDSVMGFLRLLDVGKEQSLPSYFSVLNLLLSSGILLVIYRHEQATSSELSKYWLFLSVLFLFLSFDEAASIHENFGNVQEYLVDKGMLPVLETHKWLPFGILFTLFVAAILVPFIRRLPRRTALLFLFSGFVFVSGAIGLEWLGYWMLSNNIVESRSDSMYLLRRIFEEGLEMFGIAIFNIALYQEVIKRNVSILFNG